MDTVYGKSRMIVDNANTIKTWHICKVWAWNELRFHENKFQERL